MYVCVYVLFVCDWSPPSWFRKASTRLHRLQHQHDITMTLPTMHSHTRSLTPPITTREYADWSGQKINWAQVGFSVFSRSLSLTHTHTPLPLPTSQYFLFSLYPSVSTHISVSELEFSILEEAKAHEHTHGVCVCPLSNSPHSPRRLTIILTKFQPS